MVWNSYWIDLNARPVPCWLYANEFPTRAALRFDMIAGIRPHKEYRVYFKANIKLKSLPSMEWFNPSGAETRVFPGNSVNTMAVGDLAPCVRRASRAMSLTLQDSRVLVFIEGFPLHALERNSTLRVVANLILFICRYCELSICWSTLFFWIKVMVIFVFNLAVEYQTQFYLVAPCIDQHRFASAKFMGDLAVITDQPDWLAGIFLETLRQCY